MTDPTWLFSSFTIAATIVLIGVPITWRMLKEKRSGFPLADERTQRITGREATITLNIGNYTILTILFTTIVSQEFLGKPGFDDSPCGYLLIGVLLMQSLTFLTLRWYLGKRGDS